MIQSSSAEPSVITQTANEVRNLIDEAIARYYKDAICPKYYFDDQTIRMTALSGIYVTRAQ